MYVCLCKGLKESDVALAARICAQNGVQPKDVLEVLGLRCEEACGDCEANPQLLFEEMIASEEEHLDWLETQLEATSQVGIELYLSQQLHEDNSCRVTRKHRP
jgi:bacterioferritin-associated ferredoxin